MDTFGYESKIIGALLSGNRAGEIFQNLGVDDFQNPMCQDIFHASQELFRQGAPISTSTVARSLRDMGYDLSAEEAEQSLNAFAAQSPADLGYYIRCLQDDIALSRMQELALKLCAAPNLAAGEMIAREIAPIASRSAKAQIKTATASALEFLDELDAAIEKPPVYLNWGIDALNRHLCSELGDFIIIGGRPSAGKTLLSLQLAVNLSQKYKVGYVSLETSEKKLRARAMAHLSGVSLWKIKNPQRLTTDERARLEAAARTYSKLSFEIAPSDIRSTAQIEAIAVNRRWEIVIVDYIQIAQSKGGSRYEVVTNISQELHTMAQTHGICVIGLAQLSRGIKTVGGKEAPPTLESLRESGQLEQDADAVMLLYLENSEDRDGNRILKLAKNKEGRCGALTLLFNGETQTFIYTKGE